MAQPQQNIDIGGPGYLGINTQDSPIELQAEYCSQADNCVIDQFGRIASRKGFRQVTTNPDVLSGNPIKSVGEFIADDGTSYLFAGGNNQIFIQQQVAPFELVAQALPFVPTNDNWQIIPFNNKCYFFQEGHGTLVFDPTGPSWAEVAYPAGYTAPSCGTAGYGRLWAGDFGTVASPQTPSTIRWSNLLDGTDFLAGDSGFLDITDVWPSGYDTITAIRVHNNFLIIWGRRSIVVYTIDPSGDPVQTGTVVADTVEGIGCVARDSVVAMGDQIWFLDSTGIRDFGRTIQEKSMPIGDISYNVRSDMKLAISLEDEFDIKAAYDPEDSLYTLFLPSSPKTYVFDTRQLLQNGAARATQWIVQVPRCGTRNAVRETFYGGTGGVYFYDGYTDISRQADADPLDNTGITIVYRTHPLTFGSPANVKFPKQVDVTVFGGSARELALEWAFDYRTEFKSKAKTIPGSVAIVGLYDAVGDYFGDSNEEDSYVEYSDVTDNINTLKYNIWGSGTNIRIGFTVEVFGQKLSIQEVNFQALMGRIL